MAGRQRGGTRGGWDQFKWDDIRTDAQREKYLGQAVMLNQDKLWYDKRNAPRASASAGSNSGAGVTAEQEAAAARALEQQMMDEALGIRRKQTIVRERIDRTQLQDLLARGAVTRDDAQTAEQVQGVGFGATAHTLVADDMMKGGDSLAATGMPGVAASGAAAAAAAAAAPETEGGAEGIDQGQRQHRSHHRRSSHRRRREEEEEEDNGEGEKRRHRRRRHRRRSRSPDRSARRHSRSPRRSKEHDRRRLVFSDQHRVRGQSRRSVSPHRHRVRDDSPHRHRMRDESPHRHRVRDESPHRRRIRDDSPVAPFASRKRRRSSVSPEPDRKHQSSWSPARKRRRSSVSPRPRASRSRSPTQRQ